jgi:hypothetical protein
MQTTQNLPAMQKTFADRFRQVAAEAASTELGRLLKFSKGKYYVGDDEMPLNREMVAHIDKLARGWTKFNDGKVVDQRIGKVADGFEMPHRDELGDTDQSGWQREANGPPRDPWTMQYYLPLEDPETGEIVVFVTSSHGGRTAIATLCNIFARNVTNGSPVIHLATSSYKHRTYGRIETPHLPVVGWTGGAGGNVKAGIANDLNDDIPF